MTDLFSDPLAATSLTVTAGGSVVLTTTQPHGVQIGRQIELCIVDAEFPNPVAAAVVDGGLVRITCQYGHDLTLIAPDAPTRPWSLTAKLAGFADSHMNGALQLVSVDGASAFSVLPSVVPGAITLNGNEALLERLEVGIIGWQAFTATGDKTLVFDTPETVTRNYTVTAPNVVRNVRIAASMNLATAQAQYVRGYARNGTSQIDAEVAKLWMFIVPLGDVALSKDRNSSSDAMAERTAYSEDRRLLIDGYNIFVAIPAEQYGGGVGASDLANGTILATVLRTFDGLRLPQKEFHQGDTFCHSMTHHGQAMGSYDNATYWHGYAFEAPTFLTQWDSIQPFEISTINETSGTAASGVGPGSIGGVLIPGPITPAGSVSMREINFGPADEGKGLFQSDQPQPLTAIVKLT